MATFTVLAGDFTAVQLRRKKLVLRRRLSLLASLTTFRAWEKVPIREIESLQVATEESTKRFGGAAVAGLAGGLLLGPVGLVAGAMAGGNKKSVTFELRLADGRGFLGKCDARSFEQLRAVASKAAEPSIGLGALRGALRSRDDARDYTRGAADRMAGAVVAGAFRQLHQCAAKRLYLRRCGGE